MTGIISILFNAFWLMKLFIYEHITSGALIDNMPVNNGLMNEGNQMLSAVVGECFTLDAIQPVILRDSRLPPLDCGAADADIDVHTVETRENYLFLWQQCLTTSDAVLLIAPETNNSLYQLHQQAMVFNSTILGCTPDAIMLTSNKLSCDNYLKRHAIAVAPSVVAHKWQSTSFDVLYGYIVKPIDGAGCIDTLLFANKVQLAQYLSEQEENSLRHTLVQAYIKGAALSLSLLISKTDVLVLAINRQHIQRNGNILTFHGCLVNDLDSYDLTLSQATRWAQQIKQVIPGLWGFVGIDVVLRDDGGLVVVDINPRITSAYPGVGQSLGLNLIDLLLKMTAQGMDALPAILNRQQVDIIL